jgi:hypothetical protein
VAEFQSAFSDEMLEQLVVDVYEHVKAGTLSVKKVIGVSRDLIAKRDDDGNLVYYDIRCEDKDTPINLDTMIGRIRNIVKDWKIYIAPLMETLVLEAVYQHALKASSSTQSFKAASDLIMPKESADDGNKPPVSPRVAAILQQNPVGTTIVIGKDCHANRLGEAGHERPDTVHPVADGQRQDTTIEAIPPGHDKPIHGVYEGDDTAQGSAVPDTPVSFEDTVDNDSRGSVGVA